MRSILHSTIFVFLLPTLTLNAQDCTITRTYHQYYSEGTKIHPIKLFYHQTLHCGLEVDLLDNPNDVDRLFDSIRDTIVNVVDIDVSKVDVETAGASEIIEQLFNVISYYKERDNAGEVAFHAIEWYRFFSNFGLLEGRTLIGHHPKNGYCSTFISFNAITRQDEVTLVENILDLKDKICGERYFGRNGVELFRVYFDNSVDDSPKRLLPSFLPKFLIDP